MGLAAKPRERFEHRHVGFARTVLLDALPASDTDCAVSRNRIEEGAHQRRLADARLPRHKQNASRPGLDLREVVIELGQFAGAPDHRRGMRHR